MVGRRRAASLAATLLLFGAAGAQAEVTPARACAALAAEGLVMSPWATNDEAFGAVTVRNYRCLSEPLVIPGGEGRFVTAINYYVEGRLAERVETIRLVLNVHRPQTRAAGLKRFVRLAETLFANLGLSAPPELAAALSDAQPGSWRSDYGSVRFEIWKSPIERLRLTLDLAPARPGA